MCLDGLIVIKPLQGLYIHKARHNVTATGSNLAHLSGQVWPLVCLNRFQGGYTHRGEGLSKAKVLSLYADIGDWITLVGDLRRRVYLFRPVQGPDRSLHLEVSLRVRLGKFMFVCDTVEL